MMSDEFITGILLGWFATVLVVYRAKIKRSLVTTLMEFGFFKGVDDD